MSDYHIYIKIPSYLRQWFIHRHSSNDSVRLNNGSIESKLIKLAVVRPPECFLPHSKSRDPRTYNHDAIAADFTAHGIPLPKMQTDTKPEDITTFRRFLQAFASVQARTHQYAPRLARRMEAVGYIVCGQPRANRLNILKSFYVKFERKIPALIADFCTYYAPHPNKTVIYYYDATALGSNYAVNDQDFHWVVCHEFERHGWQVIDVYLGNPIRHDEKYLLINQGFSDKQRLMPYFNRQNNDDLILAIQSAGVEHGRNGFRKNKSMEKQPESEEDLLEHRTDGTDAFDTLYIGCEKFPQHDLYPIAIGGVR